jgi:hypothetical protein
MRLKTMGTVGHSGDGGESETPVQGFKGVFKYQMPKPTLLQTPKSDEVGIRYKRAAPDDSTDEDDEPLDVLLPETPITKALGRGRKRPTSANRHHVSRPPRPRSAGPKLVNPNTRSPRRTRTRPQSAGPTAGRRRIDFESGH